MDQKEILRRIEAILDDAQSAILATTAIDQCPRMRWMTPTLLKERPGAIFVVTSPGLAKVVQVRSSPGVEWMFQDRALTEIVNVCGTVSVVDNPLLRSEVLEEVAPRLNAFWKITTQEHDLVILETAIKEATYYVPMKGIRETVSFQVKS